MPFATQPRPDGSGGAAYDQHKLRQPQHRQPHRRPEKQHQILGPAFRQLSKAAIHACSHGIAAVPKEYLAPRSFHRPRQCHVLKQADRNRRMTADRVVRLPRNQDVLAVGSGSGRPSIAHLRWTRTSKPVRQRLPASRPSPTTHELPVQENTKAKPLSAAALPPRSAPRTRHDGTVSASVNSNHSPRASFMPATRALFLPLQPDGKGPASITRTLGKDCAISRVRSVDPSSTTMISKLTPVWATSDSRQAPRQLPHCVPARSPTPLAAPILDLAPP